MIPQFRASCLFPLFLAGFAQLTPEPPKTKATPAALSGGGGPWSRSPRILALRRFPLVAAPGPEPDPAVLVWSTRQPWGFQETRREMDCYKGVTGTIYEYGALTLGGEEYIQFKQFAGKHVLFVNVATF
ncbi:Glutathione peroxidase 6 [Galemys pyrenaicus]|uniref:Glutathione peroxidase 6 n=1 Tax=Galemys pyrenaicus TaxID=202257 RepID=A0A8J5ZTI5_GALPY|nr:Glutathione peroxidase 6 [Galemys pyrenaicus]